MRRPNEDANARARFHAHRSLCAAASPSHTHKHALDVRANGLSVVFLGLLIQMTK